MKLSRSFWSVLGVLSCLLAAILIFYMWNGATRERRTLRGDLDTARKVYSLLVKQKADLNAQLPGMDDTIKQGQDQIAALQVQLGQAQVSLKLTKSQLLVAAESIEYDEVLLGFAKASNLEVTSLTVSQPSVADMSTKEFTFNATTFAIKVRGTIPDILNFFNRIVTNPAFRSAQIEPVSFDIPLPVTAVLLTQAQIDAIRNEITAAAFAGKTPPEITSYDRVLIIERAILEMLNEPSSGLTVEQMTQRIRDTIGAKFGTSIADLFSKEIAEVIERQLADSLIGIVAGIYGDEIGKLFTAGTPELVPTFTTGILGKAITEALKGIPPGQVAGVVKKVITEYLQSKVDQAVEANLNSWRSSILSSDELEKRTAAAVAVINNAAIEAASKASSTASSTFNLTVFTYKGN